MIVRDLIARVGFKTNKASLSRANRAMSGLRQAAVSLAAVLSAAAVVKGLTNIADAAADANEQMNALNVMLGEKNAEAIEKWSSSVADSVGRSKFTLQKYASDIAGVTGSMLGDTDQATAMSMALTQRAIDIGSVKNKKASEVLRDFASALAGSPETMNKYGAVLTVTNTEEFMRQKRIKGTWKEMTQAQKTQIRYMMIMDKTSKMAGDAAKTTKSYANATQALGELWKDVRVELGKEILPILKKYLEQSREAVKGMREWIKANRALIRQGFTRYIGGAVGLMKSLFSFTRLIIVGMREWMKTLPPLSQGLIKIAGIALLIAAALIMPYGWLLLIGAAVLLVIDDFEKWRKGGKSVIGELTDETRGLWAALGDTQFWQDNWNDLVQVFEYVVFLFKEMGKSISDLMGIDKLINKLGKVSDWFSESEALVNKKGFDPWFRKEFPGASGFVDDLMSGEKREMALAPTGSAFRTSAWQDRPTNNTSNDVKTQITIHANGKDAPAIEAGVKQAYRKMVAVNPLISVPQ